MSNIWFTSDLHFNHDKEFIWRNRGFSNVQEMNNTLIQNMKQTVQPDDDFYILGDLFVGGNGKVDADLLKQIPGKVHIIAGNHDTDAKIRVYEEVFGIPVKYSDRIKYKGKDGCKRVFYLSHYPTDTTNMDPNDIVINLFGHTHQKEKYCPFRFNAYHVGVDSHYNYPINLNDIIEDMRLRQVFSNKESLIMVLNQPEEMDGEIQLRHMIFLKNCPQTNFKEIKEDYYKEYTNTGTDIFIPARDVIEAQGIIDKLKTKTEKFDLRMMF